MKFRLIIDKNADECVTVSAHERNRLTDALEDTVRLFLGENEIAVFSDNEMRKINFCDVECICVLDGKSEVVDKNGKHYRIKERLYEIEQRLPNYFIKINKSAIANENAIECFNADFGGGVTVSFRCGYSDYVSRRCFADIKRRFKKK